MGRSRIACIAHIFLLVRRTCSLRRSADCVQPVVSWNGFGNIRCHYRKPVFAIGTIVTRDTLLRRYRQLIAKKYDKSTARKPGRPKIVAEIEKLILDMTRNSPGWGYTRICGALYNVGHEIGRNTDKNPRCKQRGIKFVRPLRIAKELFAASCGDLNPQRD